MRRTRSQGEPQLPLNLEINKELRVIKKNKARGVPGSSFSSRRDQNVEASPSLGSQDPKTELPLVGHRNDNPYIHLGELDRKSTVLYGKTNDLDNIKLTLFSHTLGDAPRDLLNHLQGGPFKTFEEVAQRFLKRYFPKLRSEITGIKQRSEENLQEYYERFVHLCASCPNHNLEESSLIAQFLEGMNDLDVRLLQCTSGGNINHLTPSHVRELIVTNTEAMRGRSVKGGQMNATNTVDLNTMESRITTNFEMRFSLMLNVVGGKIVPKKCGFCASTSHLTDECETPSNHTTMFLKVRTFLFELKHGKENGYDGRNNRTFIGFEKSVLK
ncbi:hypothetical protein LUZ60_006529 [Juncus effusus]|nr:hypothetical protein LUZ60_006529 [Juncus effusus]